MPHSIATPIISMRSMTNSCLKPGVLLATALLLILACARAFGSSDERSRGKDRASFRSDITVAEGETAVDVACAFCSVHISGNVSGDVAVLFGSVAVDHDRSIRGDIAALGGDVSLAEDTQIGGDVVIAAGNLNLAQNAVVHGSQMVLPGRLWLLVPFAPLLILSGLIWLVVYAIGRNRYKVRSNLVRRGI